MINLFLHSLGGAPAIALPEPPVGAYSLTELAANISYSWWCKPIAYYDAPTGVNYFCAVLNTGQQRIHRVAPDKTVTSIAVATRYEVDEHNTPALLKLTSGQLMTVATGHNVGTMYVRKYHPDTLERTPEVNIQPQVGMTQASYAQLYRASTGRILLFWRDQLYTWGVSWSDDDGANWQPMRVFITKDSNIIPDKLYMGGQMGANDVITFGINHHPTGSGNANRLYQLQLNAATGEVTEAGVSKGNLYGAWSALSVHSLIEVFAPPAGKLFRYLDITVSATHTHYLLCDYQIGDLHAGNYFYVKVSNSTNQIVQTVILPAHGIDTYTSYVGGAYFVQSELGEWNGKITLAREEAGIWYVELYAFNGSAFVKEAELHSLPAGPDGMSLTRPHTPINADKGGMLCMFQENDYNESYTAWTGTVKGVYPQIAT